MDMCYKRIDDIWTKLIEWADLLQLLNPQGCFRVLWYRQHEEDEQKLEVRGGDWVFAVEFDEIPKAYSVLAYGQSGKEDSPFYGDQLEMFVNEEMKPVAYTEEDIEDQLLEEYRPGE